MRLKRRRFLKLCAAALVGTAAYGAVIAPRRLVLSRHRVCLPGLPHTLDGMRIVQISDLHAGPLLSRGSVRNVVSLCNSCRPDLVVLTGDFVTYRSIGYLPAAARELSRLRARLGVFACLGNHDYWENAERVRNELEAAGVRVLMNENICLDGLFVAAVDDLMSGRPDVKRALEGVPADGPLVLLSHNPTVLPEMSGRECLVLAGHTHGGQIALPFLGPRRTAKLPGVGSFMRWMESVGARAHGGRLSAVSTYRYPAEWYSEGRARMYVSLGVGTGLGMPIRLNCPPEIACFTLRSPKP